MKKIALALAGASVALTGLAATPASAADFRGHDRGRHEQDQTRNVVQNRSFDRNRSVERNQFVQINRFQRDNRFQGHRWNRGDRFDSRYATNYTLISDPYYYNLQPAPYGYHWVRSGNDAILVALASGIIGALVANAF
ncbi:MAG TPA: RcnB family protein [Sphingomicrobium sp.]|nr:RcnB family protein [Sphingomicrobium sp.]